MERIIKIGSTFGIVTLACILAILTADGKLTWGTAGLVLSIFLVIGFVVSVWTIVDNKFTKKVSIGLTIGIVLMFFGIVTLAALAGAEIKETVKDLCKDATLMWLIWPIVGTTCLTFLLGLHKKPHRRPARRR